MVQKADIRRAELSDAAALAETDRRIFSDAWSEKSFSGSIGSYSEEVLAAYDTSGKILGYAVVSYILDEANINRLAVVPEYRGNGLGTEILLAIEAVLPDEVSIYNLEVREGNKYAVEMYKRSGYDVSGRRKRFYRDPDEDALLMTKRKV